MILLLCLLLMPILLKSKCYLKIFFSQYPELIEKHIIEVGGGKGLNVKMMVDLGCQHSIIDPSPEKKVPIRCVGDFFENVSLDLLPTGPKMYFFHFNVAIYIADLFQHLSRLCEEGDCVLFSQWNDTLEVKRLYASYFHFFTEGRLQRTKESFFRKIQHDALSPVECRKGTLCELLFKSGSLSFLCKENTVDFLR